VQRLKLSISSSKLKCTKAAQKADSEEILKTGVRGVKKDTALRAIMLDWAGTTVDHGSMAPVLALQSLFCRHGIDLSNEDARRDMGLLKRDQIQAILSYPDIRAEWRALRGREPEEADTQSLFAEFGPLQLKIIAQHSQLLPGVAESINAWQEQGLRIGTTTGYTREMLAPVLTQSEEGGYHPDATVCPDEVGAGRPAPWMLMRNMQLLDVYPPNRCVKIGDTVADILEGRNAGMWTIGLTRTGNLIGLNAKQWEELPPDEKQLHLLHAGETLRRAGADFVAEDVPACVPIISQIAHRLQI
jgi:phosphonoacetaldehyde hydrolase